MSDDMVMVSKTDVEMAASMLDCVIGLSLMIPSGEERAAALMARLNDALASAPASQRGGAGDGYRIALDDALPVLELCLERGRALDRMTQPSMGRHPLQDEYERVDHRLRRACQPYKLWPIVEQARTALAAVPPGEITAEEFIRREAPNWAGVGDAVAWVRQLRGDLPDEDPSAASAGAEASGGAGEESKDDTPERSGE